MKQAGTQPHLQRASMLLLALMAGLCVLVAALGVQWLIYDRWLHIEGPLRVTGSLLAGVLTFFFALRWQVAARHRKLETLRRLETIASMNDRIRNALQVIECATYATNPEATAPVRDAVDVIESVLNEVLDQSRPVAGVPIRDDSAARKRTQTERRAEIGGQT